jgi:hypothetical protein
MNHTHQPKINSRGQIMFSSPRAIAEATQESHMNGDASWIGESKADYIRKTRTGDSSRVAEAEKLLSKIEPEFNRECVVWQNSVSGAYADVAAFLANDPECMRRRLVTEDDRSPLRVWVDVASSCAISWQDLLPRGIAALALVMQLIRNGRAVELWTFASLHGRSAGQTVPCVQMCTTPIDMASVAYCLTSQGFSRGICYATARQFNGFNGAWGAHYVPFGTLAARLAGARKTLEGLAAPQDIILPAPYVEDKHDKGDAGLIFRDPVKWVLETCKRAEEGGVQ